MTMPYPIYARAARCPDRLDLRELLGCMRAFQARSSASGDIALIGV